MTAKCSSINDGATLTFHNHQEYFSFRWPLAHKRDWPFIKVSQPLPCWWPERCTNKLLVFIVKQFPYSMSKNWEKSLEKEKKWNPSDIPEGVLVIVKELTCSKSTAWVPKARAKQANESGEVVSLETSRLRDCRRREGTREHRTFRKSKVISI